jgi:hypothetical protein
VIAYEPYQTVVQPFLLSARFSNLDMLIILGAYMFMLLSSAYCSVSFSIWLDTFVCTMWEGM